MAQSLEFLHHHPALFGIFGVVLLLFLANELYGRFSGGPRLSTADAVRLINDRDAVLLDVRPVTDFKKNHLLGAISMPAANIKDRANELARHKARPIIVYCGMGNTSVEAAKTLRALGHNEVFPLRGGINSWTASNLPVTTK